MAYLQVQKFGLAIDWETSGYSFPNYAEKHQGLSFGAIVYDTSSYLAIEKLYCELKYDPKYEWNLTAEKIHGLSKEYLDKNGLPIQEGAIKLANLIIKYFGTDAVQLLGHRVNFDKAFTTWLLAEIEVGVEWHSINIDSCVLGTALMEISKSDDIFEILGMPPRKAHNSLQDIEYTLESVRLMKQYFLAGVQQSSNVI